MNNEEICLICGSRDLVVSYGKLICVTCGYERDFIERRENQTFIRGEIAHKNVLRLKRLNPILKNLCSAMEIPDRIEEEIKRFIADSLFQMEYKGRINIYLLVAYATWYVIRREGGAISLNDIISTVNKLFGKRFKLRHFNKLLFKMKGYGYKDDPYVYLEARDYIHHIVERMMVEKQDLDYELINSFRDIAIRILEVINRLQRISNPRVSAGLALSIAVSCMKSRYRQLSFFELTDYFGNVLGLSPHTLRKRAREFLKTRRILIERIAI